MTDPTMTRLQENQKWLLSLIEDACNEGSGSSHMLGQFMHPDGEFKVTLTVERTGDLLPDLAPARHCIGCGCDDLHACFDEEAEGPCSWLAADETKGVCSACPDHLDRFEAGDRTPAVPY